MVAESAAALLPRTRIRESFGDRVFLIFVTAFLTIILITVLYPLIYVISSSFSSGRADRTVPYLLLEMCRQNSATVQVQIAAVASLVSSAMV